MWTKLKTLFTRQSAVFRFYLMDTAFGTPSNSQIVVQKLHELQKTYDFTITDVYLSRFHESSIIIKCDREDTSSIFRKFATDCEVYIRKCKLFLRR